MSSPGWGARTTFGVEVKVNIYDLSPVNDFIQPFGIGVFHSGVHIGGKEYTFAGGGGIFDHSPLEPGGPAVFREGVVIGVFEGGSNAVDDAVRQLKNSGQFGPNDYNIMTMNCNHFADALCRQLLGRGIPGCVHRPGRHCLRMRSRSQAWLLRAR